MHKKAKHYVWLFYLLIESLAYTYYLQDAGKNLASIAVAAVPPVTHFQPLTCLTDALLKSAATLGVFNAASLYGCNKRSTLEPS